MEMRKLKAYVKSDCPLNVPRGLWPDVEWGAGDFPQEPPTHIHSHLGPDLT